MTRVDTPCIFNAQVRSLLMYMLKFPDDQVTSGKNRAKERCLVLVVYPELNCFLMKTLSFAPKICIDAGHMSENVL